GQAGVDQRLEAGACPRRGHEPEDLLGRDRLVEHHRHRRDRPGVGAGEGGRAGPGADGLGEAGGVGAGAALEGAVGGGGAVAGGRAGHGEAGGHVGLDQQRPPGEVGRSVGRGGGGGGHAAGGGGGGGGGGAGGPGRRGGAGVGRGRGRGREVVDQGVGVDGRPGRP